MSAQPRPLALPNAPAGIVPPDLDQQILAAELAVIAREQRLRMQARHIGQQVHQKLPALGAGAASMIGGVLLRRLFKQRRADAASTGAAVSTGPGWLAQLPWSQLSAVLWPLLPLTVRNRFSPAIVATLMATAVPLAAARLRGVRLSPVLTTPQLDLRRYAGRWYEVARLPLRAEKGCDSDVSATYTLLRGNRLRVLNRCRTRDGGVRQVRGIARASGADGAKLQLSFAPGWLRWLPFMWAPYWVLHVDPDYGAAVVGTPDRHQLWVLSRAPFLDDVQLQRLLTHARAQGFDTSRLMRTPQGVHGA